MVTKKFLCLISLWFLLLAGFVFASSEDTLYGQVKRENANTVKYENLFGQGGKNVKKQIIKANEAENINRLGESVLVNRDSAELLFETTSRLKDALGYIDKTVNDNTASDIQTLYDFSSAVQEDIKMMKEGGFNPLTSSTLEQAGLG